MVKDIIKNAFESLSEEEFEKSLSNGIDEYIKKNQGKYISLDGFLLTYGAVELPTTKAEHYHCVKFLKKMEIEYLKSIVVDSPVGATGLLKDELRGNEKNNFNWNFESGIKKFEDFEKKVKEEEENG